MKGGVIIFIYDEMKNSWILDYKSYDFYKI